MRPESKDDYGEFFKITLLLYLYAMLTPQQLQDLKKIIDNKINIFVAQNISPDNFTNEEKEVIRKLGVDLKKISPQDSLIYQSFATGLISGAVPKSVLNQTNYENFKKYIQSDKMIPLNSYEKAVLSSIEKQSLQDIRGIGEKYKSRLETSYNSAERKYYENTIRNNIAEGTAKKKTLRQISNEISKDLDTWGRDFDRIVATVSHQAFDEGRQAFFQKNYGDKAKIYYKVFEGACKICISHYLTKGLGSKPKVFEVGELPPPQANYKKKQSEWVTTTSPAHPFCYDDQTEVLTSNGWKYFKDVEIDKDLFLSVDVETVNKFDYVKAVSYIEYEHEGQMRSIKGDNIDLYVTIDHRHLMMDLLENSDNYNFYKELHDDDIFALYYVSDRNYDVGYGEYPSIDYEACPSISYSYYDGIVYDVELEKNHTLFVRRNGKISISGNCRCTPEIIPEGYVWDDDKQDFVLPEGKKKVERKSKVKIQFGDKSYEA